MPYHGMVDLHKEGGYNQGYLATIKMNNKYIIVLNISMKHHKSVKMYGPTTHCNIKTYYRMLQLSAYVPNFSLNHH